MNDLRKAAEIALEALESVYGKGQRCEAAIKALRQALAQTVDLARVGEVGVWGEKPWVKTYCGGKPNYCTPIEREDLVTNLANPIKNLVKREEKNA